jgi:hypothetical protein
MGRGSGGSNEVGPIFPNPDTNQMKDQPMKKVSIAGKVHSRLLPSLALIVLLACAVLPSGCASNPLDKLANLVTRPGHTNYVTNVVEVLRTNLVPVLVQVPVPGSNTVSTVTNFVERVTTNDVLRVETNIVYVAATGLQSGLAIGQAAAPLAGPWAPAAEAGLLLLSGGLAFLVKRKNGEAQSLSDQLQAVVTGVENVASALPEGQGKKVKDGIQQAAVLLGVQKELHASVQEHTS